jgi:hypothetical protein
MPRCKKCKEKFEPKYFNQKYCLVYNECIQEHVIQSKKKSKIEWQREKKVRKEKIMTRSEWINLLQNVFNAYIRKRDKDKPCISCGKPLRKRNVDAGHLWSAYSHSNVRFHEKNVNAQCSRPCNKDLSGDINNYRINFVKRYSQKDLDELDSICKIIKRWEIDEIKELIKVYKQKTKEL